MLSSPEERRRLRHEKAKQRKTQQKKLLIRLGAAGAVLIFCLVLILSLTGKKPDTPPDENTASTSDATQPAVDPTATVIHYAAAGDLNINEATVAAGGSGYNYTGAFLDVAHLLSDADIASVNFEGNLCGEPYGSSFSAPNSMATALQKAGVDLVQMANSYSINRGLSGLTASIDAVRSAGMEPLGVYASNAEFNQSKGYTIRTVKGIKLAFVAFTKGMDGMALPPGSEKCVNVLYSDYDSAYQTIDREKITSILTAVSKEKPDIVIALLHWGSEFNNTISKSQTDIASLMFANGVDAIIGTHSHYVQKMSFDAEKGQFVAYSLGDFFSNAQRAGSEYSVVLDLEITKPADGKAKITGFSYTPIFTVSELEQPLKVVRINQAITAYEDNYLQKVSQETYDKMRYALERIEARINAE
ncbi:MAG: CapA family protein [Oscillospiraceae bacterium]|nr:CapA family protein [Oscillospiraceae bacterium]